MLLKVPPLEINPEDPFKDDVLGRRESAEILTQLVKSTDDPLVMAIDASWGRGKTTFIKMWSESLKKNGFHYLYFNAWENDFAVDPLVALIGEMADAIDVNKLQKTHQQRAKKQLSQVKKLGAAAAKRMIPVAAKIATAGLINLDTFSEKEIADAVGKLIEQRIDAYGATKKSLSGFRESLTTFVATLTSLDNGKGNPLVFFVDELDRCRPTYAVEVLERLKHLFNVPGVVFVLALDKEQLAHSIRSLYGVGMNAEGYLRRFIDLEYRLPEPSSHKFCAYLFQRSRFAELFEKRASHGGPYESNQLADTFAAMSDSLALGLRDQEQCIARFNIVLRTTAYHQPIFPVLLASLVALKFGDPDLYRRFIAQQASANEVIERFKKNIAGAKFMATDYGAALEVYLKAGFSDHKELEKLTAYYSQQSSNAQDLEKPRMQKLANRVIEQIYSLVDRNQHIVPFLVHKIEISERFITS